ncbi:hypothetical protein RHMOL_Rhmol08G0089400 [Rhododendron molle]|uniref:Uncharacterized protein n=1 Tax=Rhododendron molle TaxID=49168 RepID=A0ACC0MLC7_RHOML|nr:hypothetical protein RHMOL_Rhmol08G0089400 [Rhododendron molle]
MHASLSTKSAKKKKTTTVASDALGWHWSVSVGSIVNCGTTVTAGHRQVARAVLAPNALINFTLDLNPSLVGCVLCLLVCNRSL